MEEQILRKNLIINGWRLYDGQMNSPTELMDFQPFVMERSLRSPKTVPIPITGVLLKLLHNVVENVWDPDIDESYLPSEGKEFKKMCLHGHNIGFGDYVAVYHGEESQVPWFGRIKRFLRFEKG